MKKISAKIVADSVNPQGDRITSFLLTFPRFILAECKTHRIISGLHGEIEILEDISINSFREGSKNSASSRAIPFNKMVKMVEEDPFIPIAWQKDHKGMQGIEYLNGNSEQQLLINKWLEARDLAVQQAKLLNNSNVTKQLCNRLLEPFMWHTVLVTATEFENFFELRCPKYQFKKRFEQTFETAEIIERRSKKDLVNAVSGNDPSHEIYSWDQFDWLLASASGAEIHIQALAEAMWDQLQESTPKQLEVGEWHIPFTINNIDMFNLLNARTDHSNKNFVFHTGIKGGIDIEDSIRRELGLDTSETIRIKIATARCARLSYMTFDGEINYEKDIKLHDHLLENKHSSPFEHCCRVLTNKEYENSGKLVPLEDGTIEFQKGWVDNFRGYKSYRRILNFS